MTANPLRARILDLIRREGAIPFSRYMSMCLYEPELGYYMRPREQFGKEGDFYTSSDVHALFGRLLCRQFVEFWQALGAPGVLDLVELGPGRGLFARDVLDWAGKKHPEFLRALRYRLVETSPWLRRRQEERLADFIAEGQVKIGSDFSACLAECGDSLIVFGNEFFDALPVEVLTGDGELRIGVGGIATEGTHLAENMSTFSEETVSPRPEVLEYVDRHSVHPGPKERVEVALEAQRWMRRIAQAFAGTSARRGFAVFIDYGYTRQQQLAGRHRDTLMTYRRHRAGENPYQAPGEQDITAHVNFTALEAVARSEGLDSLALLTQAQFLMGIGEPTQFAEAFEDCRLPQERAKVALQLKHLVTPAGIGEIFHVLVLSHGLPREAAGSLSGLKFAR